MAVKVVTDSLSDLPPEIAEELDITVVPLTVFFGEEAFKDGIEISHDEFFERLTTSDVLPHTSQPSVGDFAAVYKSLAEQGHDIVSVHASSKLSGTMNSALSAVQEVPGANIEVVDTEMASLGQALPVKVAAESAKAGAPIETVAANARDAAGRIELYFTLNTLEYLHKGGRIGKAQALLGGLLSIKPVLKMVNGEIHPYEKVRSRAKALQRMREIASKGGPYEEIAFIHEAMGEEETAFAEFLKPLSKRPVIASHIGSVVGTYTGPGVVGMALLRE